MSATHLLSAGDYALLIEPEEGGAIARFDWQREPLFRPRCGEGPLNSACFPLAPFSNRIAFGRFKTGGREIVLPANFPGSDHLHPLHGFAWLRPWQVQNLNERSLSLSYVHRADAWPWWFEAEQRFDLTASGFRHELSVRNLSDEDMPAGLGLHPYFPRTAMTRYVGMHHGEWRTGEDGLPIELRTEDEPRDWWRDEPIANRAVDTVYVGRRGPLLIAWPERALELCIDPSAALDFTVVYSPADEQFCCVEPVSHETDAFNRGGENSGMRWLKPGENWAVHVNYTARRSGER